MQWLKGFFNITTKDFKTFLKLSFLMVLSFVLAMGLLSYSWGTIPGLILLGAGIILLVLIWLMYWPWV
jgi:hypothetical protein